MDLRSTVDAIQERCLWSDSPYGRFPTKGGDGGDDCLWLGLLTSVGLPGAFDALMACQAAPGEKRAGMFYRNPNRRSNDNAGYGAFFSRDMAIGVLVGLSVPNDDKKKYDSSHAWVRYIDDSRPCLTKKPKWLGGGCLLRSPVYKFAPDDRSDIPPAMWALLGRVWDYNGWNRSTKMISNAGFDGDYDIEEAKFCPLGYVLHLHALEGYIKRLVGQSAAYAQKMLDICYDRSPGDLFYKVLAQDNVTPEDLDRFEYICNKWGGPQDNWLWGGSKIGDDIESGRLCGWDLVFMGRLMLKLLTRARYPIS